MLDTAYHKVCLVDHTAIVDLDSGLWVCFGRFGTHFNFIIIVKVLLFVVTVFGIHIRQYKCEVGIAVTVTADSSLNGSRSKSNSPSRSIRKSTYSFCVIRSYRSLWSVIVCRLMKGQKSYCNS